MHTGARQTADRVVLRRRGRGSEGGKHADARRGPIHDMGPAEAPFRRCEGILECLRNLGEESKSKAVTRFTVSRRVASCTGHLPRWPFTFNGSTIRE